MISLIVACSNNNVIGLNNDMPWRLPSDLAWFKQKTEHHTVIMGRKTFESIGRALPNRINLVVSRSTPAIIPPQTHWLTSIESALCEAKKMNSSPEAEIFIMGGGQLYAQTLPLSDRLYLTRVNVDLSGDTYFPDLNPDDWELIFSEQHLADDKNQYDYRFEILQRRKS